MAEEKQDTTPGGRSKEDIALEMMKFVAVTTNYGKGGTNTGFSKQASRTPEEHADALIELYGKCRKAVD
ncbi:MAG: hypothetical protein U5J83_07105 [Bryobacterales bacterium]|nr:hypothetical protein [Bryobacterales bacterium]